MPRFPVHTLDDAPGSSRDDLAAIAEKMGKVLNIHGGMAHAPAPRTSAPTASRRTPWPARGPG